MELHQILPDNTRLRQFIIFSLFCPFGLFRAGAVTLKCPLPFPFAGATITALIGNTFHHSAIDRKAYKNFALKIFCTKTDEWCNFIR